MYILDVKQRELSCAYLFLYRGIVIYYVLCIYLEVNLVITIILLVDSFD